MKTGRFIFKTLSVFLLMGTFLTNPMTSFAQGLEGKWTIAQIDTRHSTLIEFTKDSLIFYDFDQRHSVTAYQIKDHQLALGTGSIPLAGEFQFINPQRLRLNPVSAKNPIDFVRLQPTQTTLTRNDIEQLTFHLNYQDKILPVNFNQVEDNTGKTVRLEQIDSTYFISFYQKEKRLGALPIEEATTKLMTVYGFPDPPYVVSGERMTSNASSVQTNRTSSSTRAWTTADAILGKWLYKRIEGRSPLSDCTKRTYFQFTNDSSLHIKPYAENQSTGNCVAGATISGTYEFISDDQIKVTENGISAVWKIQSLTKTELIVKREGEALTLNKE